MYSKYYERWIPQSSRTKVSRTKVLLRQNYGLLWQLFCACGSCRQWYWTVLRRKPHPRSKTVGKRRVNDKMFVLCFQLRNVSSENRSLTPTPLICRDMRQNKGSILKASVEYIRRLKKEAEQARQIREEKIQVEKNLQKLQLKFTVSIQKGSKDPSVSNLLLWVNSVPSS